VIRHVIVADLEAGERTLAGKVVFGIRALVDVMKGRLADHMPTCAGR
jgi:hypothetical protein